MTIYVLKVFRVVLTNVGQGLGWPHTHTHIHTPIYTYYDGGLQISQNELNYVKYATQLIILGKQKKKKQQQQIASANDDQVTLLLLLLIKEKQNNKQTDKEGDK